MNKNKETAEQKLLKMIESEGGGSASKTSQVKQKQNTLTLVKTANNFLVLGLIGSLVFMGYQIKSGVDLLAKSVEYSVNSASRRPLAVQDLIPTIQRLSFYSAAMEKRNIFLPYEEKSATTQVVKSEDSAFSKEIKNLKLVGISWLDRVDTASAMIEDREKEVTYFLQTGEKINNLTVKTIYADSVELSYGNEEIIIEYDKSKM